MVEVAVPQLFLTPKNLLLFGFKALFAFLFLPILDCWTASERTKLQNTNVWDKRWSLIHDVEIDHMTKLIFKHMIQEVSFRNKTILELGCGTGRLSYLAYLEGAKELTLVDSSSEALKLARKIFNGIGNVEFIKEDIFDIKLNKKYDIVFSSGVVEHFKGNELLKCVELHKKYSLDKIIIIVPASPHYNDIRVKRPEVMELYGWQKPLSKGDMNHLFNQLGLTVVVNKRFYTFYGIPSFRGSNLLRKTVNIIDKLADGLIDRLTGGLLITVGCLSYDCPISKKD